MDFHHELNPGVCPVYDQCQVTEEMPGGSPVESSPKQAFSRFTIVALLGWGFISAGVVTVLVGVAYIFCHGAVMLWPKKWRSAAR